MSSTHWRTSEALYGDSADLRVLWPVLGAVHGFVVAVPGVALVVAALVGSVGVPLELAVFVVVGSAWSAWYAAACVVAVRQRRGALPIATVEVADDGAERIVVWSCFRGRRSAPGTAGAPTLASSERVWWSWWRHENWFYSLRVTRGGRAAKGLVGCPYSAWQPEVTTRDR